MALYLSTIPEGERNAARDFLTALAFSEDDGLPYADEEVLWPRIAGALGDERYEHRDLHRVLEGSAGNLVQAVPDSYPYAFRLFHQALNDHLLKSATRSDPQRRIFDALVNSVTAGSNGRKHWPDASGYVRRHLAEHAALCNCVSTIFTEPELAGYLAVGLPRALLQSLASLNAADGYGGSLVYRRVAHLMMPNDPHRNGQLLIHAARDRDPKFFAVLTSALGEGPDEDPVYSELLAGSEVGWVVKEAMGVGTCEGTSARDH